MNKKTDAERKTRIVKFRVNKREYEMLKRATAESGLSSMSEYVLNKIIATPIIEISDEDMLPLMKTAESVAETYNTIAIRVNKRNTLYPNDVEDMKNGIQTLVDKLSKFQAILDSFSVTPQTFRAVVDNANKKLKCRR